MKISTKGRYALRMLLDLAEHKDEGFIALKDIAKRQEISKKYLEQIVSILNRPAISSPRSPRSTRSEISCASLREDWRPSPVSGRRTIPAPEAATARPCTFGRDCTR